MINFLILIIGFQHDMTGFESDESSKAKPIDKIKIIKIEIKFIQNYNNTNQL